MIDLRSDTVTTPTPGMREAMARAVVGDDVFEDDPTVEELEARVAALLGHAAGLFVPSGTMGNAICIRVHTRPGDEVLADFKSHTFNNETGGAAAISGVQMMPIAAPDGFMTVDQVVGAIRRPDVHHPVTSLLCIENTHNFAGGAIYPVSHTQQLVEAARSRGLKLHLDGARLWNAAAELGLSPAAWSQHFDSVTVCLSKGLGAPVGSVVAGSREFISQARRIRKMLGGGMRQVGILAAAGLYALEHHLPRLKQDHVNARALAAGLCALPGISLAQRAVETNIVFIDTSGCDMAPSAIQDRLQDLGIRMLAVGPAMMRAVTHHQVSASDIESCIHGFSQVLRVPVS